MIDWINHRSGAKAQPSTVCNGVDVVCWRASSNNLVVAVPSRLPICFLLEGPCYGDRSHAAFLKLNAWFCFFFCVEGEGLWLVTEG